MVRGAEASKMHPVTCGLHSWGFQQEKVSPGFPGLGTWEFRSRPQSAFAFCYRRLRMALMAYRLASLPVVLLHRPRPRYGSCGCWVPTAKVRRTCMAAMGGSDLLSPCCLKKLLKSCCPPCNVMALSINQTVNPMVHCTLQLIPWQWQHEGQQVRAIQRPAVSA